MRGRVLATALAATVLVGAGGSVAHANKVVEYTVPARGGEITDRWYGYSGVPRARAILPDGYDPKKAYPVLFILPGLSNTYSWWTDAGRGNIAKYIDGLDAIVVTPEGGTGGWFVDWWNGGRRGNPSWESYFLDEVIPQTEERFKIRPERRYHALSGGSMGGLGAAYLGGRLPGYFGTVVISSGFVDTQIIPVVNLAQSLISGGFGREPVFDPELVYGPLDGPYATGHNPTKLAVNLSQSRVFLASGNGLPQGGDTGTGADPILELAIIHPMNETYAAALRRANVDVTYQVHAGYHDWANHRRQLRDAIRWGLFKPVDEHATSWTNDTVATHGKLWNIAYRFDAPPSRLVRFRRSGGTLAIGPAGAPVRLTTDGGCVIHVATPAEVELPARPCAKLRLKARPGSLAVGRKARIRVTVSPPLAGAVVRLGSARAVTNGRGVAQLRVCLRSPGRKRVRATVVNRLPATGVVRARKRPARLRRTC